jgi:hypothetical protein
MCWRMYRLEHRFEMRKGGGSQEVSEQELGVSLFGVGYFYMTPYRSLTKLCKRLFYPN